MNKSGHIICDSAEGNAFVVHVPEQSLPWKFIESTEGLFYCDLDGGTETLLPNHLNSIHV